MGFDLSTGDDVRSVSLRSGLRGYDKSDVDGFRAAVADLVDDLRRRADAASGHLAQLGLDDPLDLKEEFASVGKEVSAILEAARTAATDIRARATADGERWRAEASADAERMRSEAWEEASTHLETSVAEARQTRESADEDALFIRAQAEKEAIRLTSEAKRDADDLVRKARAEADSIIADARHAAEAAQERTRALEVRREELMGELEEARRAIGVVEAQIEEQHQRLMAPETTTVRIIDQGSDEPAAVERQDGWLDDDATVRLVPAEARTPMTELEPVVDADDIVAEVERLQIEPVAPVEPAETEVDDPWSRAPDVETVEATGDGSPEAGSDIDAESATTDVEPGPPIVVEEEPVFEAAEPVADESQNDFEAEPDAVDGLADLFASLRVPDPDVRVAEGQPEPDPEPEPERVVAPSPEVPAADLSVTETVEVAERPVDVDDGGLAREAVLLPITNRALRAVKKQILEFQNVMLEATKADPDGWRPDAEEYRLALDPHVQAMVDEAHRAAGGEGGSTVEIAFGAALSSAVHSAAETMSGSGYRETSASLGRIFRSWRSDEAERRLHALAAASFEASEAARNAS